MWQELLRVFVLIGVEQRGKVRGSRTCGGEVVCGTLWDNCVCVLVLNVEFQCEALYL